MVRRIPHVVRLLLKATLAFGLSYGLVRLLGQCLDLDMFGGFFQEHGNGCSARDIGRNLGAALKLVVWLSLFRREIRVLGRFLGSQTPLRRSVTWITICLVVTPIVCAGATFATAGMLNMDFPAEFGKEVRIISHPAYQGTPLHALPSVIFLTLVAPMWEEVEFRGALFYILLRLFGIRFGALVGCLVFALSHPVGPNSWSIMYSFLTHFAVGAGSYLVLVKTHRLRWCILFHSLWNLRVTAFLIVWPSLGVFI